MKSVWSCCAVVLMLSTPTAAQYFGRNKVQFKKLDFQVLKTEHFDIYFYPQEREGIDIAARMSERWLARLERLFAHELRGRQPMVLYASHPDFEQTNAIQGELGEGTGGVTEPLRRRVVLPLGGPLADTDHVIGHELVHAFQFDITTRDGAPPGQNGAERLPLWFIEGMAEYLSLGPVDSNTAMWLRDAIRVSDDATSAKEPLPTIEQLDNPKYFPYRWGQAFWAFVGGRYGDDVIRRMLVIGAAAGDYNVAIEKVLGVKTRELSEEWHAAIRRTYAPVLAVTAAPSENGRMIIGSQGLGAELNIGPALSPDGRRIAFLSTRGVFSIDLFVADASNGRILHKLTSTATDPHLSSIQFIYSAGAWDAESRRIAIATIAGGHPALVIYDAESGDRQREIPIAGLDEIFNPTWAPDGHAVAFTGMSRGLTDLFIYDLNTSHLTELTRDAYADLQPAWSPDGSRIAIATDRFSSDLKMLRIGDYRIALVDPANGRIEQLRTSIGGKNLNPQWSPDGRAIYFISDRDGIPNLYRTTLDSGSVEQLTHVSTGLSGITASSPALSVAVRSGAAAFSVYEDGKYQIYQIETGETRRAAAPAAAAVGNAGQLPPADRRGSDVARLLNDAEFGLPPVAQSATTEDYKAKLSLEGVAQPTIGVGANSYGAAFAGGIGFQFGDLLGDHTLTTAVQLQSGFGGNVSAKDTAAQAVYYNAKNRWNWGVIGSQMPYLSGGFQTGVTAVNNEPVQYEQSTIFRQTEQTAAAIVAYPFSRAQRVEFQGGVSRLSFEQVVQTQAVSLRTGQLVVDDSTTTQLQSPLMLGNVSAALVFDTSNFGATSPVAGARYRLEVAPAFGEIGYTGVLADYRRYFMPVPFYTLAARVMHYGRYGNAAQDPRLNPLFVGYPNLIRGYDVGTFDASDCVPTLASDCPEFDRLVGSRVLVGNLEFRFPLLRPFGASQRMYGPIPVEVALFADGGVAWNSGEKPALFGGSREGVGSAGVALRVNLLGFAVGQFDFSRPFKRSGRGWIFQFNLAPGW